ncbi:hypothetical protein SprV_0100091500 [Sparganum proliferum]
MIISIQKEKEKKMRSLEQEVYWPDGLDSHSNPSSETVADMGNFNILNQGHPASSLECSARLFCVNRLLALLSTLITISMNGSEKVQKIESFINDRLRGDLSPSIEYLYVDIGLGFYLEMTHKEALAYIKERTELLNDRAELFRKKSFEIKARIKVCLEGLREVQSLNVEERPDYHDALS